MPHFKWMYFSLKTHLVLDSMRSEMGLLPSTFTQIIWLGCVAQTSPVSRGVQERQFTARNINIEYETLYTNINIYIQIVLNMYRNIHPNASLRPQYQRGFKCLHQFSVK